MKYRSLIGDRKITINTNQLLGSPEIRMLPYEILIWGDAAIEDAIKLKLIEEVKPKEIWVNTYRNDDTIAFVYMTEEAARRNVNKDGITKKFIEVV